MADCLISERRVDGTVESHSESSFWHSNSGFTILKGKKSSVSVAGLMGIGIRWLWVCIPFSQLLVLLVAQAVKKLPAMQKTWIQSLGGEDPLQKEWQPTPVFLPGKFHGQRSLWATVHGGCKELSTTEQLTLSLSHSNRNHGFYWEIAIKNTIQKFWKSGRWHACHKILLFGSSLASGG